MTKHIRFRLEKVTSIRQLDMIDNPICGLRHLLQYFYEEPI